MWFIFMYTEILWNNECRKEDLVTDIVGGKEAEGVWEHDVEENILT